MWIITFILLQNFSEIFINSYHIEIFNIKNFKVYINFLTTIFAQLQSNNVFDSTKLFIIRNIFQRKHCFSFEIEKSFKIFAKFNILYGRRTSRRKYGVCIFIFDRKKPWLTANNQTIAKCVNFERIGKPQSFT